MATAATADTTCCRVAHSAPQTNRCSDFQATAAQAYGMTGKSQADAYQIAAAPPTHPTCETDSRTGRNGH